MSQKITFKTYWERWQLLRDENKTIEAEFFAVPIVPWATWFYLSLGKGLGKTAQRRVYTPGKEQEDGRHVK